MSEPQFHNLPPEALDAIHEAALTITSELSLPIVLNRIVALARELVQARYAALGIPDPSSRHLVQFVTSGLTEEQIRKIGRLPEGKGLLGELLRPDAEPIRIPNISEDPRSAGFCEHHPHMTSFLGVPIRWRGKLLGNLYLADKVGAAEFSEYDQVIIETLAAYAAVAIENARLYQRVQRLAILEERERIGMDLHDGIIQSIYAVGLTLEHAAYLLDDEEVMNARERLREAIDGLNTIIKDIRNYILDLRPERFQGHDLFGALRALTNEFQTNTLADVSLIYDGEINGRLSERVAVVAFHIIQEALANAAKHAAATHVDVRLELQDGEELVVGVRDNGRGFSPDRVAHPLGHGLSNMEMRALAIGGRVEIESAPGEGTQVRAYLPIKKLEG
ncbi:MAG TPA: GAF domain-containing protein [Chloroflexi bacterium]|nr:GAF domain-containing protein [Chloroflexota bacterium]